MGIRYLPYSTTPHRLLLQLLSDVVAAAWTTAWVLVGLAVHGAVAMIGAVGRQVQSGGSGLASNLESAGDSASRLPLVGDSVSKPLAAASEAALDLAGAGQSLDATAGWLSWLLAIAVAAPPVLAVVGPWLFLRWRFFRRKLTVIDLAATPAGRQLLALRALASRPIRQLTAISPDPAGAWRLGDPAVVGGLAELELHAAGVQRLRRQPAG